MPASGSNGFDEEKVILNDVSLEIHEHDFITILWAAMELGINSFTVIGRFWSSGRLQGMWPIHLKKRAKYLSRVFHIPTARMTVENLLIAKPWRILGGLVPMSTE